MDNFDWLLYKEILGENILLNREYDYHEESGIDNGIVLVNGIYCNTFNSFLESIKHNQGRVNISSSNDIMFMEMIHNSFDIILNNHILPASKLSEAKNINPILERYYRKWIPVALVGTEYLSKFPFLKDYVDCEINDVKGDKAVLIPYNQYCSDLLSLVGCEDYIYRIPCEIYDIIRVYYILEVYNGRV